MALDGSLTEPESQQLQDALRTVSVHWQPFLHRFGAAMAKNYGWELRFITEVLSRVPSLQPEHVSPQHPFQDMKGRRRYIDFAVRVGERRLAVEVDGFDKTGGGGPTPESQIDFTERQNALSLQGWTVLRFTNRQFSRDPASCVKHLEMTVRDMLDDSAQSREALKSYLQGLEAEIRAKAATAQGADRQMYEEQQKELQALLASKTNQLDALTKRTNTVGKVLIAVAILVATSAYVLVQSMDRGPAAVAAPSAAPNSSSASTTGSGSRNGSPPARGASPSPGGYEYAASRDAAAFVGQARTVCGKLAQVTPAAQKRPWYLNFDHPYPRQTFQAIVWPNDVCRVEDGGLGVPLTALRGQLVCVSGEITSFQGTPQIRIRAAAQLVRVQ